MPGSKEKLTIYQCDSSNKRIESKVFEAMINPASYKTTSKISYVKTESAGTQKEPKFERVYEDTFQFKEIILDGTGVVAMNSSERKSVLEQIACLRDVAYVYKGSEHQPPVIEVCWGGHLLEQARMKSLDIDYTLFKPNGDPLRAKLNISFIAYKSTTEILKEASLESPDLTHLVVVKAGDTLPMLCYRIYKDCSYYLAVARLNQLTNFRSLTPGQVLRFPPLV